MTGLTMTDCSVADNVKQAKWEFERAAGVHDGVEFSHSRMAGWALRWGESLLEVAAEHASGEYIDAAQFDA